MICCALDARGCAPGLYVRPPAFLLVNILPGIAFCIDVGQAVVCLLRKSACEALEGRLAYIEKTVVTA